MCPSARREEGFAAPLAVFIIILGATVAGMIAVFSGSQQSGAAMDVLGVQAYRAARAGAEWGIHHVLRSGGLDCAGVNGNSFSPGGALSAFQVTVQCSESTHMEASTLVTMYAITATACNVPAAGACPNPTPASAVYVERQIRVVAGSN